MLETLFELDCFDMGYKAIVFCKTRDNVDDVAKKLTEL